MDQKQVGVGNAVNLEQLIVQKYYIPHEGQITINEDGSILVKNDNEKTLIPEEYGVIDDYREVINERVAATGKIKQFAKDNALGAVGTTAKLLPLL